MHTVVSRLICTYVHHYFNHMHLCIEINALYVCKLMYFDVIAFWKTYQIVALSIFLQLLGIANWSTFLEQLLLTL